MPVYELSLKGPRSWLGPERRKKREKEDFPGMCQGRGWEAPESLIDV